MNIELAPRSRHYVDTAPFDPASRSRPGTESEGFLPRLGLEADVVEVPRHKVAVASAFILLAFYLMVPFVEVIAPYNQVQRHGDFLYAPPQPSTSPRGPASDALRLSLPFTFNLETFKRDYVVDRSRPQPIRFFCRGEEYELWGCALAVPPRLPARTTGTMFIAAPTGSGATSSPASSTARGSPSPSASWGIAVSFALGLFFGGLAGLSRRLGRQRHPARHRDPALASRAAALACAVRRAAAELEPDPRFLRHHHHLGLLDWPGLARAVRSKLMSLREEDFVRAAELMGASKRRIIARHLIPELHEPPDRLGNALHPLNDLGRDGPLLPGARPSAAGDELGRAPERGAEPRRRAASPLAPVPDSFRW
jgi:peptide/nickel transport system permease protein